MGSLSLKIFYHHLPAFLGIGTRVLLDDGAGVESGPLGGSKRFYFSYCINHFPESSYMTSAEILTKTQDV